MLLARSDASLALLMIVVVGGVLSAASWVYRDASAHARAGDPVVCSMGGLQIRTPAGWFIACVLVFELFIPTYLDNRRLA